jgi:hypothetical protein
MSAGLHIFSPAAEAEYAILITPTTPPQLSFSPTPLDYFRHAAFSGITPHFRH